MSWYNVLEDAYKPWTSISYITCQLNQVYIWNPAERNRISTLDQTVHITTEIGYVKPQFQMIIMIQLESVQSWLPLYLSIAPEKSPAVAAVPSAAALCFALLRTCRNCPNPQNFGMNCINPWETKWKYSNVSKSQDWRLNRLNRFNLLL